MKVTTLNNLKEFLNLMKTEFGKKELSDKHRNALDTYILNVDYTQLEFDTDLIISDSYSSSEIGTGAVGYMVIASL